MPKVALVLAGGVSLGSYEGGVLAELLYALDRLNRRPGKERYVLDVVTGASAGAMTAALVARATMNNHRHRQALHDVWVDKVDILELIEDSPPNSLLSKKPIERVADDYLRLRDGDDQPASYAPDTLRMTLTLSNINGVDFSLPIKHTLGERFTSTFFSDRRVFRLSRDGKPELESAADHVLSPETWSRVKQAAIGSGNFPFAFAPARVATKGGDYEGNTLAKLLDPFFFVDGGMFNNEPIREAVELSLEADGASLAADRIFLLVDPNLNRSKHDARLKDDLPFIETARRLLEMLLGESSANDWLRAQRLNNQIGWRDELIEKLVGMVAQNELADAERLERQLHDVAGIIVEKKRKILGARKYPANYLEESLRRTMEQHAALIGALGPTRQRILTHMIFVLNSIAGLDKKHELNLSIIFADPKKVAGDPIASFGGFFAKDWREHDYRLGRRTAHQLLPEILSTKREREAGLSAKYEREAGVAYEFEQDLRNATMQDIPEHIREEVKHVVMQKAKDLVKPHLGGRLKSWLIWEFGLKKKIEEVFDRGLEL